MSQTPPLRPILPCILVRKRTTSSHSILILVHNNAIGVPMLAPYSQIIMLLPPIRWPAFNSLWPDWHQPIIKLRHPPLIHSTTILSTSPMNTIQCHYIIHHMNHRVPHRLLHSPFQIKIRCRWTLTGLISFESLSYRDRNLNSNPYRSPMFDLCSVLFTRAPFGFESFVQTTFMLQFLPHASLINLDIPTVTERGLYYLFPWPLSSLV